MGKNKISCNEFKIIDIPPDMPLDVITQAIKYVTHGRKFTIREKGFFSDDISENNVFFSIHDTNHR